MQDDARRVIIATLSGIGAGAAVVVATGMYLDSIEIDDGLEALIALPALALACALPATVFGFRRMRWQYPLICGFAAAVTVTAIVATWVALRGHGGPPVVETVTVGAMALVPFGIAGALAGHAVGMVVSAVFRRGGPGPPQSAPRL